MENKLVILIVDDVEVNRMILRNIFMNEFQVLEAGDGREALALLKARKRVDIILLDLVMPYMNGIEFLRTIKSDRRYNSIPVVVNTELGEKENEAEALELGADDFIAKPYVPNIIRKRVRNLVEKYILQKKSMERALRNTQKQVDILIDTIPGGIGIYQVEGEQIKALYYNNGLREMLGYSTRKSASLEISPLDFIVYEDQRKIKDVIVKKSNRKKRVRTVIRMIKRDNTVIWVDVSAKKMISEDGNILYYAIFSDQTEELLAKMKLEESMQELKYRAERDPLTGIYNRDYFYARTQKKLLEEPNVQYVIVYWNIDHFKVVNELFGSAVGDRVLIEFATFLSKTLCKVGTYGRLDSDHFAMSVPQKFLTENQRSFEEVLKGKSDWCSLRYPIMSHVGLYMVEENNSPINILCDRASLALQQIKGSYVDRWMYYNEKLRESLMAEQELENEIDTALAEHQFIVNFQPIFSTLTEKLVSAEALVRWKHPEKGIISPRVFIPLFERNGVITKLDIYVLRETCKLLAKNKENGRKNVPISVNLSRINFHDAELCDNITKIREEYSLPASLIKIEITESAYTENPNELLAAMHTLQKQGYKILMDDFGSGYSSLNMLKDVPADILKIDMNFMDDLEKSKRASNILFSIIQMAKNLRMEVIAEGVETKYQAELLAGMGSDCIQGYYYSKPLSEEDFVACIEKSE